MSWLFDTNIISELRKGEQANANLVAWYAEVDERDLFLSALVLGEIRKGIEGVRPRNVLKAQALEAWLTQVETAFKDRILGIDAAVADQWGRISALRTVPVIDGLLAATAIVHDLTLVTRNTQDVSGRGAKVLNPFTTA